MNIHPTTLFSHPIRLVAPAVPLVLWLAACAESNNPEPVVFQPMSDALEEAISVEDVATEPEASPADATMEEVSLDASEAGEDAEPDVPPEAETGPDAYGPCDNTDEESDEDGDGWTILQGDCNDCVLALNPGAFDYKNGLDDDCNGLVDDESLRCDEGLALEGLDPYEAARAIGLCKRTQSSVRSWGVLDAQWVFADGSAESRDTGNETCQPHAPPNPFSRGLLPKFGDVVEPRAGAVLLALSSGVAREGIVGQSPAGARMCTKSRAPEGFPTPSHLCLDANIGDSDDIFDSIALQVTVRVPTNGRSLTFDFDFHTYEYPEWVCSDYNDFFVTLLFPSEAPNHNICYDSLGNPVSVNNGFLEVCNPGEYEGRQFTCPLNAYALEGTGFESRGATGWLRTAMPIEPGSELTLRFAIWDAGDFAFDSTVLIDNFRWWEESLPPETNRPPDED